MSVVEPGIGGILIDHRTGQTFNETQFREMVEKGTPKVVSATLAKQKGKETTEDTEAVPTRKPSTLLGGSGSSVTKLG